MDKQKRWLGNDSQSLEVFCVFCHSKTKYSRAENELPRTLYLRTTQLLLWTRRQMCAWLLGAGWVSGVAPAVCSCCSREGNSASPKIHRRKDVRPMQTVLGQTGRTGMIHCPPQEWTITGNNHWDSENSCQRKGKGIASSQPREAQPSEIIFDTTQKPEKHCMAFPIGKNMASLGKEKNVLRRRKIHLRRDQIL